MTLDIDHLKLKYFLSVVYETLPERYDETFVMRHHNLNDSSPQDGIASVLAMFLF